MSISKSQPEFPPAELSERACEVLKLVVERYILVGQPVGSKLLADHSELNVSAATVRNTLSELEQQGYLSAPHTSSGRVPTSAGYRFFVDTLLRPQAPEIGEFHVMKQQLMDRLRHGEEAASSASELLSSISHQAAVVSVPRQNRCKLQQIEFLPLGERKVLAVLLVGGMQVQNRIFELPKSVEATNLHQAASFINERYGGRDLLALRELLSREVNDRWQQVDKVMRQVAEFAEQVVNPGTRNKLAVAGRGNLLSQDELLDVNYLRGLFDALDQKREILSLLDRCLDATGIRIYIGRESGYDILDNCSLITAPYQVDGETAGVLGVIGPQRMDYRRIISLVDATANALGGALDSGS